jgi:hypothetical protein
MRIAGYDVRSVLAVAAAGAAGAFWAGPASN